MENNLESQDIGRYCQSAENKHGVKKSYVVDITEVLPVFRAEVNQHHPILGDGEIFTLFKFICRYVIKSLFLSQDDEFSLFGASMMTFRSKSFNSLDIRCVNSAIPPSLGL